jgi:Uma2 family endonuclease
MLSGSKNATFLLTLIVEVLSLSTKDYNRGTKFDHYRSLSSVQEYVIIAQDRCRLAHYVWQPDNSWVLLDIMDESATFFLSSIGCSLSVAEVYAKVSLAGS